MSKIGTKQHNLNEHVPLFPISYTFTIPQQKIVKLEYHLGHFHQNLDDMLMSFLEIIS